MTQEARTQWQTKDNRKGVVDDYTVIGFKYESAAGETAWHITSWLSGFDPIHDFWVAGDKFYSVSIHFFYQDSPINVIEIYEPPITTGIPREERKAVLKAIAGWEQPVP